MTVAGHRADVALQAATELHHGSHNQLLAEIPASHAPLSDLDAIIVPTAWPVDALRGAIRVGRLINRPVVALCSKSAKAEHAVELANDEHALLYALDATEPWPDLPSFQTDRLLRRHRFGSTSDLSLKRNLGLILARGAGWKRILFLDDDIHVVRPEELRNAAGLLGKYRAVGLNNVGFEDNSVVCHAYRAIGGKQDSFIGGGAMLVDAHRSTSFFPNIYNEDWLFLLGDGVPFKAARSGQMAQRTYDPYANSKRAAAEELGDTLAEGLYWLLDSNRGLESADESFWGRSLFRRRAFLDLLLAGVDVAVTDDFKRQAMRNSLEAARGRSAFITPRLCQDFVQAWTRDLRRWEAFIAGMPAPSDLDKFLAEMGMSHTMHRSARVLEPEPGKVETLLPDEFDEFDELRMETRLPASAVAAMVG